MILSFYQMVKGDVSFRLPQGMFSPEQISLMKQAKCIILPPICRSVHYWFCKKFAPVFPCMDTRFHFPGKVGHIFLFELAGIPYPPTKVYHGLEEFKKRQAEGEKLFEYPFVVKWSKGGGGVFVHLVKNKKELFYILEQFRGYEKKGPSFIIQPYIEHDHCDLRVVVIGNRFLTYWRCQQTPGEFRSNVSRGARIFYNLNPKLEQKAISLTKKLCQKTGINLAAMDIMFSKDKKPFFLEINYGFGVHGLGGFQRYKEILNEEVKTWINSVLKNNDKKSVI
ncbi:MAG TPA: ATP-grasp domain-containing protein [Candidatus Desulfofervidus auxilii]|uniref:ATP-grasp domain-containing protein n=1 Tax=Desulfofervidus auxilii TaxID=1621989 RepID=A0A7C0Y8T2_DESA2|nr:ATP-grasp domain-containing protein [Candidatus Desulfofervidus auxilii]